MLPRLVRAAVGAITHDPAQRLAQLRAMPYPAYLLTPEWQATRGRALKLASYRCKKCRATRHLQVHHLTYERLGCERMSDLLVLYETCHKRVHGKPMTWWQKLLNL